MDNVSNGSGQGPWRGELDGGPSRVIFFQFEEETEREPKEEDWTQCRFTGRWWTS